MRTNHYLCPFVVEKDRMHGAILVRSKCSRTSLRFAQESDDTKARRRAGILSPREGCHAEIEPHSSEKGIMDSPRKGRTRIYELDEINLRDPSMLAAHEDAIARLSAEAASRICEHGRPCIEAVDLDPSLTVAIQSENR